MNKNETELNVQALVDGELTGREAEELRRRLESDAELKALHTRLTAMRGLMVNSELPRTLPESGDFHWSKIAQAIEREERQVDRTTKSSMSAKWLLRWVVPLAGVVCLVLVLTMKQTAPPDLDILLGSDYELELSVDDLDVMTFNTGDDAMSIVWLDYAIDLQQDSLQLWLD